MRPLIRQALLATATGSGCPCFPGPLNAKWTVINDPLEHLQLCFPFAIWAVKKELLMSVLHMLIQRDSHKLCSEAVNILITRLNLIYHYSKNKCLEPRHWPSDSWCHFLGLFQGCQILQQTLRDRQLHITAMVSLPALHSQAENQI